MPVVVRKCVICGSVVNPFVERNQRRKDMRFCSYTCYQHRGPLTTTTDMENLTKRFWTYVNKKGPIHLIHGQCWIWVGTEQKGYGHFNIGNKFVRAHRFCWMLHYGEIPSVMNVLHHCDNPSCVNPDHLFIGTDAENMEDKVKKGRQTKGEGCHSHRVTEEEARSIKSEYQIYKRYITDSGKWYTRDNANELANKYNVSKYIVTGIGRGETWKHI